MVLVFLVLWIIHNSVLLSVAQRRISENQTYRLNLLGQIVRSELEGRLKEALKDPFVIYSLAAETGAARIVLMDRNGMGLVDSQGIVKPGEAMAQLGVEPSELLSVWEGGVKLSDPYHDDAETTVRSLFLPFRDSTGDVAGIARISIEVPPSGETEEAALTALLLKIFGVVMVFVIIYTAVRSLRASQRRSPKELGETGAMIETFQGVVRQLKEKEQELERSKGQAEQRVAHMESYNENILQSVASGVITFDQNHQITTFNPAAERVLGMTRQEAIGKTCELVFGKGSPIDQLLEEALAHEVVITRQEFELHRKGLERIWVGVSTSLLRDRQDQIIGATFVFTDLTEIKHLQEQVELKRRLTVLGEMSAGIAHEFRNFMGTIMGFAKLLSKRLEPKDTRQGMIQAITEELQAMNRLIEQLLSFGRHTELNLTPVDLEPFLRRQILHVLAPVADHNRPKLTIEIPPGLPRVGMDEVLMRQAMGNLLQNALEAMPHGGELSVVARALEREALSASGGKKTGRLPAQAGEMVRQAHHAEPSRSIVLEITDTGVGIPKDKLDKIFLPFFTTKEKGTGMGLALVHKIVLSHNGRIEVESAEGRGTTFRIYLPVQG